MYSYDEKKPVIHFLHDYKFLSGAIIYDQGSAVSIDWTIFNMLR